MGRASPARIPIPDGQFAREVTGRLASVERLDPEPMADLFSYGAGADGSATTLRHVLQNFLLRRTVDHARGHTAYYAGRAYGGWAPGSFEATPDLEGLPLLGRDTVVDRFEEFLADDVRLRSVCHTCGTTGTPLHVYKSHEEIEFIQRYYRRLIRPASECLTSRPLVLTLPNVNHGVPVPMPGFGMPFVAGVTDDTLIEDARRVLRHRFAIPGHDDRISILTGLAHHVLLLTSYLIEQGVDPRDLGLRSVTVTGCFLPRNWIEFLEDAWGCAVNDRFTLTEAIGGASRVPGTDVFELDPHLVGEVVDSDSGRRSRGAVGLLVLTNLYPFVQMQPLIRYTVGDLVRAIPGPGPLRFQFLGKVRNCVSRVRGGRREWLLFSARLNELLAALPDVNVYEWFSNVRVVHDRTIGSLPRVSVESSDGEGPLSIRVSVELRYAPHTRKARVGEVRRALLEGLRNTPDSALAACLDAGEASLDLRFVGPGALDSPLVIKV